MTLKNEGTPKCINKFIDIGSTVTAHFPFIIYNRLLLSSQHINDQTTKIKILCSTLLPWWLWSTSHRHCTNNVWCLITRAYPTLSTAIFETVSSITLCTLPKWSFSLLFPFSLSLTNAFTYPIEFQIALRIMSELSVIAGTLSSKNPNLYYSGNVVHCVCGS